MSEKEKTVDKIWRERFPNIDPFKYVKVDRDELRFNLVTDSLHKNHLLGGVATALMLATLYVNDHDIPLRLITRFTPNNPEDFEEFLKLMGLKKPRRVEYFSDYDRLYKNSNFRLETSDKDIYLATSWWSADSIKKINMRDTFFYILQEVETFFYPNSEDQYLCTKILEDQEINYIINSRLLYDYYKNAGYENVVKRGIYFEPAFPENVYAPGSASFSKGKERYKLFFYARPKNPRNLFYIGLKILDQAIATGVIDTKEWDIYMAGSDLPPMKFSDGTSPKILGCMGWSEYKDFVKTVDLGLCLMYTPHPSYPPLDIASSGGVVVTNKYLNKQTLKYSPNILSSELDDKSMLETLSRAVALAKNPAKRRANYEQNKIERNWAKTLKGSLSFINDNK